MHLFYELTGIKQHLEFVGRSTYVTRNINRTRIFDSEVGLSCRYKST